MASIIAAALIGGGLELKEFEGAALASVCVADPASFFDSSGVVKLSQG